METVLERIEFVEGAFAEIAPCTPLENPVPLYSASIRTDTLPESAAFFVRALMDANAGGEKTIYLPNGVYDLGALTLTAIEADGISIIGESMEGTIIRNKPDYRLESISKTATLRIANDVEGTVLRDLTVENALDYYANNNGRAVCLWDQGTKTICKNVRLLSHQDTYYSDKEGGLKYFEDCEIHGTVDYICGDGNVWFNRCLLYCERRGQGNEGADYITASKAAETDKGYVFESCKIKSECPVVSLGRSWNNYPKCVFLRTTLDFSAGEFSLTDGKNNQRWTLPGMRVVPACFGEYRTKNVKGKIISPKKHEVVFYFRGQERAMNTILTAKEAKGYTLDAVLGPWAKEIPTIIQTNQYQQQ